MTEINKFVIEFDYNLEALNTIKTELSAINKQDVTELEEAIKQLVKVRRSIETKGKTYRDDANAFNKTVLAKEKEYVSVLEPLEVEYKGLIEIEKQKQVLEARKGLLPNKKKQLSLLKVVQPTDEEILAMDDEQWVAFYDSKFTEHEAIVTREAKAVQDEKDRVVREEQIKKESAEKARLEAEAKAEKEKQDIIAENDRKEKARLDQVAREKKMEEDRIANEAREKAEIESQTKYQDWLKNLGYTEETKTDFIVEKVGNRVRLSKILGIYVAK